MFSVEWESALTDLCSCLFFLERRVIAESVQDFLLNVCGSFGMIDGGAI